MDRIHDLVALLDDAVNRNSAFEQFREFCETANALYFEARCPFMVEPPTQEEVKNFLAQTEQRIEFILAEFHGREHKPNQPEEGGTAG